MSTQRYDPIGRRLTTRRGKNDPSRRIPFAALTAQALAAAEHPFIIWTPKEAVTIRERVERESLAAEEYARAAEDRRARDGLHELFRFGTND